MRYVFTAALCCLTALCPLDSFAQQNALYSQYMFNPFAINPAYAGSRQATSAVLLYRNHWVGIDGAPETQTFAIHTPLKANRVAVGFNVLNETIGPRNNFAAYGTYAYHLPLNVGKLSMGLRAGIYRLQVEESVLDFKDKVESFDDNLLNGQIIPSFDFGAYYYANKMYAGLSLNHLSGRAEDITSSEYLKATLHTNLVITGGYAHAISNNLLLKPSIVGRLMANTTPNLDINFSALMYKTYWLGVSYRSTNDLIIIAEFNITDFMRIGYSYDLLLGDIRKDSKGSHEFFLGADFEIKSKKKFHHQRYF